MNNQLNYSIIEITSNGQLTLQTLGLYSLLGIELSMQPVIPQALTRGIIEQVAQHLLSVLDSPSLFNDPWIQYSFKETQSLCLLPFTLLEDDGLCHIIVPDEQGYYPWHLNCQASFKYQADETLILKNFLAVIKSLFLSQLIVDVALEVYKQIGIPISLEYLPPSDIPDYLAEMNLDMFIALTLCFNTTMSHINTFVLSACHSISLNLTDMIDPISKAKEITSNIHSNALKEKYTNMIIKAFYKLTES